MEASIFIADGVEECEALLVVDLFRRAGIEIQTVAVNDKPGDDGAARTIISSHEIPLICDAHINSYETGAEKILIVPGGTKGVQNLQSSTKLREVLRSFQGNLAAVCAGPTVLGSLGLLDGREATVYPGFDSGLGQAKYMDKGVVQDGSVITGRALGSSIDFALRMITVLRDEAKSAEVAAQICYES